MRLSAFIALVIAVPACGDSGESTGDADTTEGDDVGELTRDEFLDELNGLIYDFDDRCDLGSPPKWPEQPGCSFDAEVAAQCLEYAREQYADRECSDYFVSLIAQCSDAWYGCKSMG